MPWGDYGRWLHEVERFAGGEVLYRDFTWPFPPLALWLVGGWMKVFGTGLAPIHVLMSLVLIAILACHAALLARLLRSELVPLVSASSVLLALALAQRESASLALGMYSPAAPLAILLLLCALVVRVDLAKRPSPGKALLLGVLCGAMVLTKQDVWLPAAFLALSYRSMLTPLGAATTLGVGVLLIAATAGPDVLPLVLTGFNHVQELGGLGLPDLHALTLAGAGALAGGAVFALIAGSRPRWWILCATAAAVACLVIVWMNRMSAGMEYSEAVVELGRGLLTQVPPLLLPVALAAVVFARRSDVPNATWWLAALVFVCLTRSRRAFQFAEWYHALIELPIYAMVAVALAPVRQTVRRLQWGFAGVLLLGGVEEWTLGRVPLVGIGRLPATETPRGTVHWRQYEVDRMQWLTRELEARDPEAHRPLFAYGYLAGYAYFLKRVNPTGMSQGFRLSRFDPDSVVRALHTYSPPIFLLDSRDYDSASVPVGGVNLRVWNRPRRINHYVRYDRPYFERLLSHCQPVSRFPGDSMPRLVLLSCGRN